MQNQAQVGQPVSKRALGKLKGIHEVVGYS